MFLDVRTIGIVSAVTPLVLGLLMLIYLRERKVYAGFGRWILANFGLGLGYLFISLRNIIPDFISIIFGNVFIIYCAILVYEGIGQFYGNRAFSRLNYSILGVYILLQTYFTYADPNINVRVFLSSLVLCIIILRAGFELLFGSIPELLRTSRGAAIVFFVTAFFPLLRAVLALLQPDPIDIFSDRLNSWISVVFIVSIVAWTFYFFFLNSARLELDFERTRAELERIASTDPLTNLYNRRYFNERANTEFQRAKRYGDNLSFLVLDMDDLKLINDTYGHDAGDRVLTMLSRILRSQVRRFDLAARFGGDEFIVMLVGTDKEQAYSIADRIRKVVEQTQVEFDSHSLKVRLSVGVATVDPNDTDLELILTRGDHALYRAKKGRSGIVVG